MAAVSIRDLDDDVRDRLRVRAARNGRSMEAEMRAILTAAANEERPGRSLADAILARFADAGGVDLELPPRSTPARAMAPPE
jgi:plasmid stability protein